MSSRTSQASFGRRYRAGLAVALTVVLALGGCGEERKKISGYIEADMIRVAPAIGGPLLRLSVTEGQAVAVGDRLFQIESQPDAAEAVQAEAELSRAQANLSDISKGLRPEEIERLEARRQEIAARKRITARNLERTRKLVESKVVSDRVSDDTELADEQATAQLQQAEADLAVARMPARADQVAAAQAAVRSAEARQNMVKWRLEQKSGVSPIAGRVQELLFREGEYVPTGRAILTVMASDSLRVRFFLGARDLARTQMGAVVSVRVDGCKPLPGRISRIADKAEYTPPILFDEGNREKLVFLVEARLAPGGACEGLRPGLPADVDLS